MRNRFAALALVPAAAISAPAFAAAAGGPDFSELTSAVDFGSTSSVIMSVGALAIGLTLVVVGIRKVMQMVRGA